MSLSTNTEAWVEVARSLGEQDFLVRYPGYFLLSSEEPGELTTRHETNAANIENGLGAPRRVRRFELRWIANAPGGPSSERITVGRAGTCDIVFRTPGVSKTHALFRAQDRIVTVKDLGSKNGTYVNGKRLTPGTPESLSPHDRIQFSGVQTMLIDARELRLLLARIR